jgi:hypothetical protein
VTFSTSATGSPTNRIAIPIAVAVAAQILALRIRDEITALSKAFPISACPISSAGSERKIGERSGWKPSFVVIG